MGAASQGFGRCRAHTQLPQTLLIPNPLNPEPTSHLRNPFTRGKLSGKGFPAALLDPGADAFYQIRMTIVVIISKNNHHNDRIIHKVVLITIVIVMKRIILLIRIRIAMIYSCL